MKKVILLAGLIAFLKLGAQHSISGTFRPAENFNWLIAYKLTSTGQNYIGNAEIKEGAFVLNLPKNSVSGSYRLVYAVPQEDFYFDVLYDGKEGIELSFDAVTGLKFYNSEENILRSSYFREISNLQEQLMAYYALRSKENKKLKEIVDQIAETQKDYEERAKDLLAEVFIKANTPYIPGQREPVGTYLENRKKNYFDALDFDQPLLRASDFLKKKIIDFALTVHPLELKSSKGTEETIKENIRIVAKAIAGVDDDYSAVILYELWKELIDHDLFDAADFLYQKVLRAVVERTEKLVIIQEIELYNRLRLGARAPELHWQKDGVFYGLDDLEKNERYILVFWSSTCSHCLNELPKLHTKLSSYKNIGIMAIGLEDEAENWKKEAARFPNFQHTIALGKWESDYALRYGIIKTPTYFILDADKRITAKPEDYDELLQLLD